MAYHKDQICWMDVFFVDVCNPHHADFVFVALKLEMFFGKPVGKREVCWYVDDIWYAVL